MIPQENTASQWQDLLAYLEEHGSITGMDCIRELGILNYKGRICDLRKMGYIIETRWMKVLKRNGRTTKIAVYILRGKRNEER